jgi:uncharacterized membrane protein YcgQ (UPF0703/DUF1980 family)
MKIFLLIFSIVFMLGLVGCANNIDGNGTSYQDDIIEITDPDFAEQIEEIQANRHDYLGRIIRYEGAFTSLYWEPTGETFYYIARVGGCCGFYGFEVYLNDIPRFEEDTWVEITGTLEEFFVEEAERYFMRLNAISIYEREEM